MRFVKLALCVLLLATLVPVTTFADASAWEVDNAHTTVAFEVRHFFTQVPGSFNDFSGMIHYDPENPSNSKVEFTVQADSIDTNNERRDQHLRSADFFNVEKFPTLSFTSTRVEAGADNSLQVTGDLTIHGVTQEVTVPVEFLGSMGQKAGFATEFKIDRKDFGVTWNRTLDQGGAILGDEVTIDIDIEANAPQPEEEAAAE